MLVALHRGEGFIARAIRWQTRSVYSHASVLLEDAELVIEAREFQGVRVVMWNDVVASGEVVDLFRVKDISMEQEKVVREFLWEQMGKGYDYTMVARFISRRQEARASSGKWFCSELVFAALAKAGVKLLERIEAWEVSPGVLRLSTRLEEMKSEEGGMKISRNIEHPTSNSEHREVGTEKMDTLCFDSPLTPALSPKLGLPMRGEGGGSAHVSRSLELARENGQVGKGSTESRPTGMRGAGEGACTTMADGGVCPTRGLGQARGNSRSTIADSRGEFCVC